MSPLTSDERARVAKALRNNWHIVGTREVAHGLADKLEAEPEPDLMGALARSLTEKKVERVERERDEAREALRELLEASVGLDHPNPSESAFRRLMAARSATRAVLEGVACAPLSEEERPS